MKGGGMSWHLWLFLQVTNQVWCMLNQSIALNILDMQMQVNKELYFIALWI